MDVYEKLYQRCTLCNHYLCEHYSTYTLNAPNRLSSSMECSVSYLPPGEKWSETVTMETKLLACPCQGFSEVLPRDEHGLISSIQ